MSDLIKFSHYRIKNIITDFGNLSKGENVISLLTKARIGISENNNESMIEIIPEFTNQEDNRVVLKVTNTVYFSFSQPLSNEEKIKLLKEVGAEIAYNKTREAISEILRISNIDFMNIPEYSSI